MMRAVVVLLFSFVCSNVSAHSLSIFVRDEAGVFKGRVYFTGGDAASGVVVTVSGDRGEKFGETKTDHEGNFEYSGPRPAGTAVFVSQTPDGHRAEAELRNIAPVETESPRLVPSTVTTTKSFEAEMTDLHAAIDRLEHRLWIRDVIGGIGYIFGLAGLWALWKARGGGGSRH